MTDRWHRRSTFEEKVEWMVANPQLWYSWHIEGKGVGGLRRLVLGLKSAGLLSPITNYLDCKLGRERHEAAKIIQCNAIRGAK